MRNVFFNKPLRSGLGGPVGILPRSPINLTLEGFSISTRPKFRKSCTGRRPAKGGAIALPSVASATNSEKIFTV